MTAPASGSLIVTVGNVNIYTTSVMINDVSAATQTWVQAQNYVTLTTILTFTSINGFPSTTLVYINNVISDI